jgi:hypothetical protein
MLRTCTLATLLVSRLTTVGPMPESAAIDALESRSVGRSDEAIEWAIGRGLVRRVQREDGTTVLEAAGARTLTPSP